MEQFKARHAKDYGSDFRPETVEKAPMVKAEVKKATAPVPVAIKPAVEYDGDMAEVVEVEESENWWDL